MTICFILQRVRDGDVDLKIIGANKMAANFNIKLEYRKKTAYKRKSMELDESANDCLPFKIWFVNKLWFNSTKSVADDFCFLYGETLMETSINFQGKCKKNLAKNTIKT